MIPTTRTQFPEDGRLARVPALGGSDAWRKAIRECRFSSLPPSLGDLLRFYRGRPELARLELALGGSKKEGHQR